MTEVQVLRSENGVPAFYVVPADLWDRVKGLIEDAEDVAAYDSAKKADDGFRIPHEVVAAEIKGVHPLQAWREYRKLSQLELAGKAGVSKGYISRIESGLRAGTTATLGKLAAALGVSIAELLPST